MPGENDAGQGSQQQQQQGQPPAAGTQGGGQGDGGQPFDGEFDPVRARELIDKLRPFEREAKELKKQLDDAMTALKAHEDEKLTEQQKAQRRIEELEATKVELERRVRSLTLGASVRDAAAKAGAVHPDAVERLVDLDTLEVDDEGRPKDLDKVLEQVRERYPALFQPTRPGGVATQGPRTPASSAPSMNDLIRGAAGRR